MKAFKTASRDRIAQISINCLILFILSRNIDVRKTITTKYIPKLLTPVNHATIDDEFGLNI
ncbi:hypothetical protein MASR1M46_07990 [Bacteroidales bacterium]